MGILRVIVTVFAVFTCGYLYGQQEPQAVILHHVKQKMEIRDSYFNKCEMATIHGRKDGSTEQSWTCHNKKFFLISKPVTYFSELEK